MFKNVTYFFFNFISIILMGTGIMLILNPIIDMVFIQNPNGTIGMVLLVSGMFLTFIFRIIKRAKASQ